MAPTILVLYPIIACMTVQPVLTVNPVEAMAVAPVRPTQPIARPDLPVVCRQLNEWTTANWPAAQGKTTTGPK